MSRVPGVGGKFISASDITIGDRATIKNEAGWIDTQWTKDDGTKQQQYVVQVEYKGETRQLGLTMESCRLLATLGEDSKDWIDCEIEFSKIQVIVGGKRKMSIIAMPLGMKLDDEGKILEGGEQPKKGAVGAGCQCDPATVKVSADNFCLDCGLPVVAWDEQKEPANK